MANIFFSLAGEGRGHATRIRAVLEQLRGDHQLHVFAPGFAYSFLENAYTNSKNVRVHRIPGLEFHYRHQKLDYFRSFVCEAPRHFWRLRSCVSRMSQMMRQVKPDLAVTDFEPILPRAAKKCGVPFLSFDHQHFLLVNDLSSLPRSLRWKARVLGLTIPLFYRGQVQTIVSSFFSAPLKRGYRDVVQTGVLLRPEILSATPKHGQHLLVYLRRFSRPNLLNALQASGRDVRIYGLGAKPRRGSVRFFEIDESGFLEDLAGCDALVTNGGNQLLGEALWLKKPVLALPETGNFEQAVNAHFLKESGCGNSVPYEKVNAQDIRQFLAGLPEYRGAIRTDELCGNHQAVRAIVDHLPLSAEPGPIVPARNVA